MAGECVPVDVDSEALPAYTPGAVFGGGNGQQSSGKCFPTEDCMDAEKGFDVTPDMEDCSVEVPADEDEPINIAVKTGTKGGGVCKGSDCLVPLDRDDDFGWKEAPKTSSGMRKVGLPPAVCARIMDGRATGVRASRACETKTAEIPTCGPWSSVSGEGAGGSGSGGNGSGGGSGGSGGSGDPYMCPGFIPGQDLGDLTGDPELDAFLQASSDLKRRAEELKGNTVAACMAILNALGQPSSVGNPPTDEEVTTLCTTARDALGAQGGYDLSLVVREGFCLSAPGQVECEADCGCPSTGFEERCDEIVRSVQRRVLRRVPHGRSRPLRQLLRRDLHGNVRRDLQ